MRTGFVILNYNSFELTRKLALKISTFHKIDKVVVVDNFSTDQSYERLISIASDKVDVLKSDKNGGYSYGNNIGAKHCLDYEIEILFISNPDVDVDEHDIDKIIKQFSDSEFTLLSGIEYDMNGKVSNPPIWKMMTYKDDLLDCFFIGRKLSKVKRGFYLNQSKEVQKVQMFKGSFFAIRIDGFFEVGGLDESVFLFCEERILSRKLLNSNKMIGVVTNAKYKHNHSASINNSYKSQVSQIKILYKSRLYYNLMYNNIGKLRELLLKYAMKMSIFEYYFIDMIRFLSCRLRELYGGKNGTI